METCWSLVVRTTGSEDLSSWRPAGAWLSRPLAQKTCHHGDLLELGCLDHWLRRLVIMATCWSLVVRTTGSEDLSSWRPAGAWLSRPLAQKTCHHGDLLELGCPDHWLRRLVIMEICWSLVVRTTSSEDLSSWRLAGAWLSRPLAQKTCHHGDLLELGCQDHWLRRLVIMETCWSLVVRTTSSEDLSSWRPAGAWLSGPLAQKTCHHGDLLELGCLDHWLRRLVIMADLLELGCQDHWLRRLVIMETCWSLVV